VRDKVPSSSVGARRSTQPLDRLEESTWTSRQQSSTSCGTSTPMNSELPFNPRALPHAHAQSHGNTGTTSTNAPWWHLTESHRSSTALRASALLFHGVSKKLGKPTSEWTANGMLISMMPLFAQPCGAVESPRGFRSWVPVKGRSNARVMPQRTMDNEAVDRALGREGQPHQPLVTGLSDAERDSLLERSLCFPDRQLPTGELANWAVALIDLGKEAAVMASLAAIETTVRLTPTESSDLPFVNTVVAELQIWLNSPKGTGDLQRLGNLWWTLTRNRPSAANTPLGDAAAMAWLVAGYDPEGWGDPPEDSAKLLEWLDEAANNVGFVVDVFSLVQQAVGPENESAIVQSVRSAVSAWRGTTAA